MAVGIRKKGTQLWIATDIDSGGMSAYLTQDVDTAAAFRDKENADKFITRLKERYPTDEFVVDTPNRGDEG